MSREHRATALPGSCIPGIHPSDRCIVHDIATEVKNSTVRELKQGPQLVKYYLDVSFCVQRRYGAVGRNDVQRPHVGHDLCAPGEGNQTIHECKLTRQAKSHSEMTRANFIFASSTKSLIKKNPVPTSCRRTRTRPVTKLALLQSPDVNLSLFHKDQDENFEIDS